MFHRIDDMESMPANRFWCFVDRLAYYDGAVAGSLRHRLAEHDMPPEPEPEPEGGVALPIDPTAPIAAADQLDALHAHPLFGDVPGLPPIFSHSTAPLLPEGR